MCLQDDEEDDDVGDGDYSTDAVVGGYGSRKGKGKGKGKGASSKPDTQAYKTKSLQAGLPWVVVAKFE